MTPVYRKMYTQYDISVLLQVIIGYNNKTDLHDITEILLKVRLNTITMTLTPGIGYIVQWNLSYQGNVSHSTGRRKTQALDFTSSTAVLQMTMIV
jgi:hypothetical protein